MKKFIAMLAALAVMCQFSLVYAEDGGESRDTWNPVTEDIMKDNSGQNQDKPNAEDPKPGNDSKTNISDLKCMFSPSGRVSEPLKITNLLR